jgi:hypothetical protein
MKIQLFRQSCPFRLEMGRIAGAILVGLALLIGIVHVEAASTCLDRFLVRPGDTLTGIASIYGFDWRVIAELNDLERPYDLDAGQWLCLPAKVGAEAAARTPHPSRLPRFTARTSGKWVVVQAINFPARNVYAVKAADSRAPAGEPDRKIGTLRTKKGGDLQVRFLLPDELRETSQLEICLKNTTTDILTCQIATTPFGRR